MAISYVSKGYHERIFGSPQPNVKKYNNEKQLNLYGLADVEDPSEEIPELEIPEKIGNLVDLIAEIEVETNAVKVAVDNLIKGQEIETTVPPVKKGWQKYYNGKWIKCQAPKNSLMVLDTETVPSEDGDRWYPFLAVARTRSGLYVWWGDGTKLVDIGPGNTIVAHNACYDRSMVAQSYVFRDDTKWLDTLSLATAVRGVSGQQVPAWIASQKKNWKVERWVEEYPGGLSLSALYKFYTGQILEKDERNSIVELGRDYLKKANMTDAFHYCLTDVNATRTILGHLWYEWLESCPSPLSLKGMLIMSQEKIPIGDGWNAFLERAEEVYQETLKEIEDQILGYAKKVYEANEQDDPWYSQLDWSTTKRSSVPKWYRTTLKGVTLKNKDVAFLLKLKYNGHPVVWADFNPGGRANNGFGYYDEDGELVAINNPSGNKRADGGEPLVKGFFTKDFRDDFENGVITSDDGPGLSILLKKLTSTLNWTSSQKRIKEVHTVSDGEINWAIPDDKVIGTLTRRKAGPMWPVISNTKKDRIGTETKCHVNPPPGYKFVQTDVDSEELRLFALLGDIEGKGLAATSPLSVSVLCGQKSKGNDVHSLVAEQLSIDRLQAKGLVYGTIYGMSLKGFKDTLKRANPRWPKEKIEEKAIKYQQYFKTGSRGVPGIGSGSFDGLDRVFRAGVARTHILDSAITKTLRGTTDFMTTRKNWVVQSAGRDFLDSYISFIDIMARKLDVDMKLFLTIHDSVHYIVPESQEKQAAYVIGLAHTYTWALVIREMGLKTLPKALLLPESIDVDTMLRKTPEDPCVTPSKSEESAPGYSMSPSDIAKIQIA